MTVKIKQPPYKKKEKKKDMEFDMVQLYPSKISRDWEKNTFSIPEIHFAQESKAHIQEHEGQVTLRTR